MKRFFIFSSTLLFTLLTVFSCNSNGGKPGQSGIKPLPAPQNVKAEPTDKFNMLKVSWANVNNNEGYVVSYKKSTDGTSGSVDVARNSTDCELKGLKGTVEYSITVKAKGDGKKFSDSPESAEVKATPKGKANATPIPVPPNFKAEATGNKGQVRLTWDVPKDSKNNTLPKGYLISYKETASQDARKTEYQGPGGTVTKVISGLTDGVEYSFWIVAQASEDDEKWDDSAESAEVKATPKYETKLVVRGIYVAEDYDPTATAPKPADPSIPQPGILEYTLNRIINAPNNAVKPDEWNKDELSLDVVKYDGKKLLFAIGFSNKPEDITGITINGAKPGEIEVLGNSTERVTYYHSVCDFTSDKAEVKVEVNLADGKTATKKYTFIQKEMSQNTDIDKVIIGGTEYDVFILPDEEIRVYIPNEKKGEQTVSVKLKDNKAKYQLHKIVVSDGVETLLDVAPGSKINISGKDDTPPFALTITPEAGDHYKWKEIRIPVFAGYQDSPTLDKLREFKIGNVDVKNATSQSTAVEVTKSDFADKIKIIPGDGYSPEITNDEPDNIFAFSKEKFEEMLKLPQRVMTETSKNDYLSEGEELVAGTAKEFVIFIPGELFPKDEQAPDVKHAIYHIWLKLKQ